jgi:hypothetical protein
VTYFFVEGLTGEDLGERDKRFKEYLMANGWTGEMGEDDLKSLAAEVAVFAEEGAVHKDFEKERN